MARTGANKEYKAFRRGLITEANPLSFPDEAFKDGDNMDLRLNGALFRRPPIDLEPGGGFIADETFTVGQLDTQAITTHRWPSVGGNGDLSFMVVQTGLQLRVFNLEGQAISASIVSTIDLGPEGEDLVIFPRAERAILQSAPGKGRLFFCGPNTEPFYLKYDEDTESVSLQKITIRIRDFEGIDDGLAVDERPETLTEEHLYNLLNQGWGPSSDFSNESWTTATPPARVSAYENFTEGKYPANNQVPWAGVDVDDPSSFDPARLDDIDFGSTRAAQGHFIYNAFSINRSNISNITGIAPNEFERRRPSTIAFFAGRVWYAGVDSDQVNGTVYFSRILDGDTNVGDCFQRHSPTAQFRNDLLPTDGGVIDISEIERIVKLVPVSNGLAIIATNGVWLLSGGQGGFTTTDFGVRKLYNEGCYSPQSVLSAEGVAVFWSPAGIYIIQRDQETEQMMVSSISEQTIQTFYNELSFAAKVHTTGVYDVPNKRFVWLFNDTESYDGNTFRFVYNRALIFDLRLRAFYTYTFAPGAAITSVNVGPVKTQIPGTANVIAEIENEDTELLENRDVKADADQVIVDTLTDLAGDMQIIFLTFYERDGTIGFTFGRIDRDNPVFADWQTVRPQGWQYDSYVITGDETFSSQQGEPGALSSTKQAIYVYSFFNRTEEGYETAEDGGVQFDKPSACQLRARWEWSDSQNSGRWTRPQQAYRHRRPYFPENSEDSFDQGFPVTYSRLKIRGKGKALSLEYRSIGSNDLKLLGFSIPYTLG